MQIKYIVVIAVVVAMFRQGYPGIVQIGYWFGKHCDGEIQKMIILSRK